MKKNTLNYKIGGKVVTKEIWIANLKQNAEKKANELIQKKINGEEDNKSGSR
ncbi:hypothetical protein [Chryseobacterium balustinum]|uniref:hypothetical protein n=1 Tax=Chryseobacterium balustinum TaxID=246 RepID=UPI003CF8CE8B